MQNGWKFEDGWLIRGQVKKRPSERSPVPQPWEPGYNPLAHSVAVRMGGEPVYYGREVLPGLFRLQHNGLYVDQNGCLTRRGNVEGVCIGCGTERNAKGAIVGGDYRWTVRAENPDPRASRHRQLWTYCRVCVTEEELQSFRAFHQIRTDKAETKQRPERAGRRLI